jgi:hypothetical protein
MTKTYVKTSHMSNQQKAKFVGDVSHIQSFSGGHGKISLKTCVIQEGMICPKC